MTPYSASVDNEYLCSRNLPFGVSTSSVWSVGVPGKSIEKPSADGEIFFQLSARVSGATVLGRSEVLCWPTKAPTERRNKKSENEARTRYRKKFAFHLRAINSQALRGSLR